MSKAWKWGDRPPKWIMKEFEKALTLMGKNSEVIHLFDVSPLWTFCIAIVPTSEDGKLIKLLRDAIGGAVIDSERYFPDLPRCAVHGDLYP